MSEEQLKGFLEAVAADAELQEKLKAATDVEAVVAIAEAAGFVVSAEELEALVLQVQAEMSEEELQGVVGGGHPAGIIDTAGLDRGEFLLLSGSAAIATAGIIAGIALK